MNFREILRGINPIDRAHEAPASGRGSAADRMHRINRDLPRGNETFAEHYQRTGARGDRALASVTGVARSMRSQDSALSRRAAAASELMNGPPPSDPIHAMGEVIVENANAPTARLLDIPMGQHLMRPELEPGRDIARGYRLRGVLPVDYQNRSRGDWLRPMHDSPDTGIGLIMWGTDLRRSRGEIFADVERVTGAPEGYLTRLSGHESVNDIDATPGTSSASGYFQIIDSTWANWTNNPNFRSAYQIPPMERDELAGYRGDIRVDGAIASEIARDSYNWLRNNGVEAPTEKALYMGHFGSVQGLTMARDQARGGFQHQFGAEYFTEQQLAANEAVFFHPKRDASGNVIFRTVERNGRTVRVRVGDRTRPYTSEEVWANLTHDFQDRPVEFRARANGSSDPLTQ